MPMKTTLVTTRSPPGCIAELAIREPDLADDLGGGQVAVEALLRGRAEGAVHRAADLAGDAQRAAAGLGDEHHLDALRRRPSRSSHLRVPSAETCDRMISGDATSATSLQALAKAFARSVIWSKSATQRLYSHFISWRARNGFSPIPATNASSSARVSPSRFVFASGVASHACHRSLQAAQRGARAEVGSGEEVRDLGARVVGAVGAVHDVLLDAGREVGADRALVGLLRVGGAHQLAVLRHGVLAFQHLHDDRTGDHVARPDP